jgi:hypothetical protein
MSTKSTPFGLVSLLAVASIALGGCAATVGHEPASTPVSTVAFQSAYVPGPAPVTETRTTPKPELPAIQNGARQASATSGPIAARRRGDCGL